MQNNNSINSKPVSQYLRCFIEKIDTTENGTQNNKPTTRRKHKPRELTAEAQAILEIGRPYEGHCLVFDTETTTDNRQALRFGIYAIYGIDSDTRVWLYRNKQLTREALDKQQEIGIFYNPAEISDHELAILKQFAIQNNLKVYEKADFIRKVFYPWIYQQQALCIGHNLPFDLSRLATCWGEAKGQFYGGFWLTLCDCRYDDSCFDHPPVRVKSLGGKKALFDFRSQRKPSGKISRYRGRFLDTATFGRALLGPGDSSLAAMGKRFKTKIRKKDGDVEHGNLLNEMYLRYAVQDLQATWSLYQAEREVYRKHGLSKAPWKIFSEASIGKAYLHDLGIPPFLKQHAAFPRTIIGQAMTSYYGGRTEVRIRLQPTEVIYTDFTSEYPTVNALMKIQELLLAEKIEVQPCLEEVQHLIDSLTINDLLMKEAWPSLRCFVRIIPDGDLLPVRTTYGEQSAATNIGLNYVDSGPAAWYCLADVLASKLLTGRTPKVIDAFKLVPQGRIKTKVWRLFGDERFSIDLEKDDLFARVIEMRADIKEKMKVLAQDDDEFLYLDGLQQALKLIANSTSYGVLVEINPDDSANKCISVHVYTDQYVEKKTKHVEEPGPYFMGPCGALIPAAGRLLLAMAEKLAVNRGIDYVLCDTDSMAFAHPESLNQDDFHEKIKEICDAFKPLSPYSNLSEILKMEDVNNFNEQPEPLYCIGISSKRYVLYNKTDEGYRIRKFSSHGTGGWMKPAAYESTTPEPCENVYKLGGHRWMYDLWYSAIQQIEFGKQRISVYDLPFLTEPALTRVTVSTAMLLKRFKGVPGIRPFSFMTMLPSLNQVEILGRLNTNFEDYKIQTLCDSDQRLNLSELKGVAFYAPYGNNFNVVRGQIRRMDNNELVTVEHKTLAECVLHYFSQPESKAGNPKGIGHLERQHLRIIEQVFIGKETHRIKDDISEASEGILDYEDAAEFLRTGLADLLKQRPMKELVQLTGIPRRTLYDIINGTKPKLETRAKILKVFKDKGLLLS
ncbi:MAG: hypothetical protein NMNS01_25980 [Nitrosomonas sp.]|nr:MAG: hypothetical protein NMNS01_25980 [Nitrosomonas sp.]